MAAAAPMSIKEITAVAIDKDKHSQSAVKWAVDHLLSSDKSLVLIHVRVRNHATPASPTQATPKADAAAAAKANRDKFESEIKQLYLPYRGYCARKGVRVKEVVLDDVEISEAIMSYIQNTLVTNIVVGASSRGFLQNWSKKTVDVPTALNKNAPDFCSVYVIAKGKTVSIKEATRAPPIRSSSPKGKPEDATRRNLRNNSGEGRILERNHDYVRSMLRESAAGSPRMSTSSNISADGLFTPKTRYSTDSESRFSDCRSYDMSSQDFSISSTRSSSASQIEAEMRRLKLEVRQTMDMYSNACKEAVSAKQKAQELQQWKTGEAQKVEDSKLAEETAMALVRMEKAKAEAAIESAQASKKLAELEAMRRMKIELEALSKREEKNRVLNALSNSNIRYRKYDIEDIRASTNDFSDSQKIGEGGYGPVYRAYLEHTPVAVKVLRSDAAQGMRQFQQEVEVLTCIRHPNMVLLLGACPEYGCLVYEYMDNGSLEDRLYRKGKTPPIPWHIRFRIAAEIATGLLFLHQSKPEPIVHRDLKPGNILLDHNYVSKISDVGLARLVPPSVANSVTQYHMTSAAGTFCYIDPEYQQTGMLGTKSDIYSLGVMLLQIITAKPPMGLTHQIERSIERGTLPDMLDPTVPDWPVEETLAYAKLALKCAELRKKDRPDLDKEILPELNRIRGMGNPESDYIRNFGSGPNSSTSSHSHHRSPNQSQERMRSNPRMPYKSHSRESGFSSETASSGGTPIPSGIPQILRLRESGFSSGTASTTSGGASTLSDILSFEDHQDEDD